MIPTIDKIFPYIKSVIEIKNQLFREQLKVFPPR